MPMWEVLMKNLRQILGSAPFIIRALFRRGALVSFRGHGGFAAAGRGPESSEFSRFLAPFGVLSFKLSFFF